MDTVRATDLKNRLGAVLARAALGPLAIERHGRVVAYITPVKGPGPDRRFRGRAPAHAWNRRIEERVVNLVARGDFRPSRWQRAGDPRLLAGICMMLASDARFDRPHMLALAERLAPGMSRARSFGAWLAATPVRAERVLALLDARLRERTHRT